MREFDRTKVGGGSFETDEWAAFELRFFPLVILIDEATPSLNQSLGAHWSRKHALRDRWHWLVRAALNKAKFFARPQLAKARITVERYGPRILDADNCRAGTKFMIDGLRVHGVILDDKPAVIGEPQIHQIISKTERKTVVRIEAG